MVLNFGQDLKVNFHTVKGGALPRLSHAAYLKVLLVVVAPQSVDQRVCVSLAGLLDGKCHNDVPQRNGHLEKM